MTEQSMKLFEQLADAVLTTAGETDSALRRALVEETELLCNSDGCEGMGVTSELDAYVRKIALYAYRVTDEDIERLLHSGYSEDAIFEITLSIAVGAGVNCLTRSMAAVREAQHAFEER